MNIEKCPFCGSEAEVKESRNTNKNTNDKLFYVSCLNRENKCPIIELDTYECDSPEEAIELWNTRFKEPTKFIKKVSRKESMSPDGSLSLFVEEDGDIIVTCTRGSKDAFSTTSVEFTISGAYSKHTVKALKDLMVAMEKDNENS